MDDTKFSKFLSLVLRHQPEVIGLPLDEEGWAEVSVLLNLLSRHGRATAIDQLRRVVAESDKQRFRFSEDGRFIRANQGHSIRVELNLAPRRPPEILFHGTATRFLDAILAEGLNPGTRQQVHLSRERDTAFAVGRRHGKPVVLTVSAGRMEADGFVFFLSDNGVWLTDRVPPIYLSLP
ncbi:MAG: RNA 2'-phosphotransferase [Akkermansiaceae bacterium]|nr:RNA 2'-phosphotransferase [Akkermansiaceae bacterium]